MELEDLKDAWQKYKREHPSEEVPSALAADTRQKAEERDRKFYRDVKKQIVCGLFGTLLLLSQYKTAHTVYAKTGLIIVVLGCAMMLAGSIRLKLRSRVSHPELPPDKYLMEQRNKILERIALFRVSLRFVLPASILGLLLWLVMPVHSFIVKIVLVGMIAVHYVIGYWYANRRIRKEMVSVIEEIDQEIADYKRKVLLED